MNSTSSKPAELIAWNNKIPAAYRIRRIYVHQVAYKPGIICWNKIIGKWKCVYIFFGVRIGRIFGNNNDSITQRVIATALFYDPAIIDTTGISFVGILYNGYLGILL